MRLAADLRSLAGKWSVQLHAVMIAVSTVYQAMPALDPSIAAMLPVQQQVKAIGLYAFVGLILRILKQKPGG